MSLPEVPNILEKFIHEKPLPVMVRAILERSFSPQVLDGVFDCFAQRQYTRDLLFSSCVALMISVVTRVHPTLGAAIRDMEEQLPVGRDCIYDKINALEDDVVSAAVAVTAADLADVVDELHGGLTPLFPGLRSLILDGNHLGAVEHRLKVLRDLPQAALPGTCVALLDADRKLFLQTFLLQDGHASENRVLDDVVAVLRANDLLIADRNFCTRKFAAEIEDRQAYFLIRQHGNRFPLELLGERRHVGDSETGRVYEQSARYWHGGAWRTVRRISVELFKPTRNDDTVLHLVTNLPEEWVDPSSGKTVRLDAIKISKAYIQRWRIETAFQKMTVELNCELNTLGYPSAALFAFCVAAMCYNAYSVTHAALRAHFGEKKVEEDFSTYYMGEDISSVWEGMQVAVGRQAWTETFACLSRAQFAASLLTIAARINPRRYRKAKTKPKPSSERKAKIKRAKSKHTSVYKELKKAKLKC